MNLRDYKPIIDALMDGKTVQFAVLPWRSDKPDGWEDLEPWQVVIAIGEGMRSANTNPPCWFRIKPEPREWVFCAKCKNLKQLPSNSDYINYCPYCATNMEHIHVREVKEDK